MGCKLYSNIISPDTTEGNTENIGEGLHLLRNVLNVIYDTA